MPKNDPSIITRAGGKAYLNHPIGTRYFYTSFIVGDNRHDMCNHFHKTAEQALKCYNNRIKKAPSYSKDYLRVAQSSEDGTSMMGDIIPITSITPSKPKAIRMASPKPNKRRSPRTR